MQSIQWFRNNSYIIDVKYIGIFFQIVWKYKVILDFFVGYKVMRTTIRKSVNDNSSLYPTWQLVSLSHAIKVTDLYVEYSFFSRRNAR